MVKTSFHKLACTHTHAHAHMHAHTHIHAHLRPISHFPTGLRSSADGLDPIMQNQPGSDLVLADDVRFSSKRSGPEACWCARIIWPASGQRFGAVPITQALTAKLTGCKLASCSRDYAQVQAVKLPSAPTSPRSPTAKQTGCKLASCSRYYAQVQAVKLPSAPTSPRSPTAKQAGCR